MNKNIYEELSVDLYEKANTEYNIYLDFLEDQGKYVLDARFLSEHNNPIFYDLIRIFANWQDNPSIIKIKEVVYDCYHYYHQNKGNGYYSTMNWLINNEHEFSFSSMEWDYVIPTGYGCNVATDCACQLSFEDPTICDF